MGFSGVTGVQTTPSRGQEPSVTAPTMIVANEAGETDAGEQCQAAAL